jgi:hypothetical protein
MEEYFYFYAFELYVQGGNIIRNNNYVNSMRSYEDSLMGIGRYMIRVFHLKLGCLQLLKMENGVGRLLGLTIQWRSKVEFQKLL